MPAWHAGCHAHHRDCDTTIIKRLQGIHQKSSASPLHLHPPPTPWLHEFSFLEQLFQLCCIDVLAAVASLPAPSNWQPASSLKRFFKPRVTCCLRWCLWSPADGSCPSRPQGCSMLPAHHQQTWSGSTTSAQILLIQAAQARQLYSCTYSVKPATSQLH